MESEARRRIALADGPLAAGYCSVLSTPCASAPAFGSSRDARRPGHQRDLGAPGSTSWRGRHQAAPVPARRVAVGARPGTALLHLRHGVSGRHSLYGQGAAAADFGDRADTVTVEVISLEQALAGVADQDDLLKLDVTRRRSGWRPVASGSRPCRNGTCSGPSGSNTSRLVVRNRRWETWGTIRGALPATWSTAIPDERPDGPGG